MGQKSHLQGPRGEPQAHRDLTPQDLKFLEVLPLPVRPKILWTLVAQIALMALIALVVLVALIALTVLVALMALKEAISTCSVQLAHLPAFGTSFLLILSSCDFVKRKKPESKHS